MSTDWIISLTFNLKICTHEKKIKENWNVIFSKNRAKDRATKNDPEVLTEIRIKIMLLADAKRFHHQYIIRHWSNCKKVCNRFVSAILSLCYI